MSGAGERRQPADGADPRLDDRGYDAVILVSFGGPEGPDDVIPFLENVTRGRNIPRERLAEVGHHYDQFGGVSPINGQNRELITALEGDLAAHGIELPVYFGNRNWHPYLADTLRDMRDDGVQRALAFFTSAFSSYSGCRQYREDIYRAQSEVGADAPEVLKLRAFYNHPGFVEANADRVREALAAIPGERRPGVHLVFTAHSIPSAMAAQCRYEDQLAETSRLVAEAVGQRDYSIVYQSRSGAPHVPWLEPDVSYRLRELREAGVADVVVSPVGFVSDHMEVLFDLDVEAAETARDLGLNMVRAGAAGTHPAFVAMIRELVQERLTGSERSAVGRYGPSHEVCPSSCCLPGTGKPSPWDAEVTATF
jgi:ferrochelatase